MERCKEYFIAKNAKFLIERIRTFTESSATVELAAVQLNCAPAEIAKSLSFLQKKAMSKAEAKAHQRALLELRKQQAEQDGSDSAGSTPAGSPTGSTVADADVVMIVAAGDAKVNAKKYKEKFLGQPKMLKREEVEPLTGFPPGGVCPFGVNDNVKVYLDVSLKRFATVYPAVGTANSGVGVTTEELETYASNVIEWVDLCDSWQGSEAEDGSGADAGQKKKIENEAAQAAETTAWPLLLKKGKKDGEGWVNMHA